MAIVNYSPWADAANFGQGLGASLTNLLLELPRIRQQQALLQAHQQLYGAQAGAYQAEAERDRAQIPVYGAQAEHYKAQTGVINATEQAKERLGNSLRQIPTTLALGGSIDPLISDAVDNLARLPHSDRASLGETLAQMLEMSKPRFRTALALGDKMNINIPSEGAAFNTVTGQPEYERPQKLGYGENLVGALGNTIAQGRERPFAPGRGYGASLIAPFARAVAEEARVSGEDLGTAFKRTLGMLSDLQPNFAQSSISGGNMPVTNAPAGGKKRYWNPATQSFQDTPP